MVDSKRDAVGYTGVQLASRLGSLQIGTFSRADTTQLSQNTSNTYDSSFTISLLPVDGFRGRTAGEIYIMSWLLSFIRYPTYFLSATVFVTALFCFSSGCFLISSFFFFLLPPFCFLLGMELDDCTTRIS